MVHKRHLVWMTNLFTWRLGPKRLLLICCKGRFPTHGQQLPSKATKYQTARDESGKNALLQTSGLVWVGFAIMPGHPIFTKSTLINISALPTRLNLSSVHCNRLSLADRPYSLQDRACQSKHKDNPVIPAYTAYNKKHLWWPFSEVLALAFWSN